LDGFEISGHGGLLSDGTPGSAGRFDWFNGKR